MAKSGVICANCGLGFLENSKCRKCGSSQIAQIFSEIRAQARKIKTEIRCLWLFINFRPFLPPALISMELKYNKLVATETIFQAAAKKLGWIL